MQAPSVEGFEVQAPLGSGAMSSVWLARERETGRPVALKILHPHLALSSVALDRFLHETRAYARLGHPNVITCVRSGRSGETWFVALEHLEGGDLRGLIGTAGHLPPETAAWVLGEVLKALAHVHRSGLVHRDLKPENVMMDRAGGLKLTDFGIAMGTDFTRLTEAGTVLGTPAYMAPEQLKGGEVDGRADLWSAGVLLYELVTGRNPFSTPHSSATATLVERLAPAPLGYRAAEVPEGLEDVAFRLLRHDPAERPESAEQALADLDAVIAAGGFPGSPEGFRAFVADPIDTLRRWREEHAARHLRAARALLQRREDRLAAAYFEILSALDVDGRSPEALELRAEVAPRLGLRPERGASTRARELERQAEEQPSNLLALANLTRLSRAEGDLLRAVRAYRWGRRRGGTDRFALHQLASALGHDLASYVERDSPASLRTRIEGQLGGELRRGRDGAASLLRPALALGAVLLIVVVSGHYLTSGPRVSSVAGPGGPHVVEADRGQAFLDRAAGLLDRGDCARALAVYERFLRERPKDPRVPDALFRSARALEELERPEEAMERYRSLLRRFPSADVAAAARLRLAARLERLGDPDGALELLDPLRDQGDLEERSAVALRMAGILARRGDLGGALAVYDGLLGLPLPDYLSLEARLGRARILVARSDPTAAAWILELMERAGPESRVGKQAAALLRELGGGVAAGP